MTGPKTLGSMQLEGSYHSHQVPLPAAFKDDSQFEMLSTWLKSYKIDEFIDYDLVDKDAGWFVKADALRILPKELSRRPGMLKESYANYRPLDLPEWKDFGLGSDVKEASLMKSIASAYTFPYQEVKKARLTISSLFTTPEYLAEVVKVNGTTFRIFSPDEFESNKLDGVFANTMREFEWDPESASLHSMLLILPDLTDCCSHSREARWTCDRDALRT